MRLRSQRKALARCRQGRHRYGPSSSIGGGMSRQTCSVCGATTIDISQAYDPADGTLFASPRSYRSRDSDA